jgi:hypothetical protein
MYGQEEEGEEQDEQMLEPQPEVHASVFVLLRSLLSLTGDDASLRHLKNSFFLY